MRRANVRLLVLSCALSLVASCDKNSPLAPDGDPVFASIGGLSLSLTATPVSPSHINLTWQDVSTSESGYEVHRAASGSGTFSLLWTTPSNASSFSDASLAAATEYCYRIRAFKNAGRKTTYSSFSNTSCATTEQPPPPPPGPAAPSGTNARPLNGNVGIALITWTDNSADENGFRIERAPSADGPWGLVITAYPNTTSHYDYNQPLEQQLCYRVAAFYAAGGVSASNVDCTYLPATPSGLTVNAVSAAAVELQWADNSAHEDGYDVERSETGGWPFTTVASIPPNSSNTITFTDATVSANKTYTYRVWVTKEDARGGVSSEVNAITAADAPAAPSTLDAMPSGSNGVLMYWGDASTNEAGFRVERSENSGASWATADSRPANSTGFFDGGRAPDQQVCYRVFAFNSVGDSPPSPVDCATPPAGPTNLVATTAPGLAIDLTWSDNSSVEDGYEVQRYVEECGGYYYYYCNRYYATIATLGPNATSYRDAGLSPAVQHSYLVLAVKDGGYSTASNEASAWSNVPPAPPSNLTAAAVSQTRIDLAWSDNSADDDSFLVLRCTGAEAVCGDAGFTASFWVNASITTFSDITVVANTTYTYSVRSYNGHFSEPSNRASATTLP
jgi:hypothetical protein